MSTKEMVNRGDMKKIQFIPENDYILNHIPPPLPSKQFISDWYKNGEYALDKDQKAAKSKSEWVSGGMKSCAPFLDSMISGYMVSLWVDVEVYQNNEDGIKWRYVEKNPYNNEYQEIENLPVPVFNERTGDLGKTIPRPAGHRQNHLIFNSQWGIKTPKNWSIWYCHPQNRFDLPFTTLSGFVDSDQFWNNGNVPFFLKEDFIGIIPKGTPLVQLIPIKRESWVSTIFKKGAERLKYTTFKTRSNGIGYYTKNIWYKKEYN